MFDVDYEVAASIVLPDAGRQAQSGHPVHFGSARQIAMKIALGSDHAGFDYKERIKALLKELGHDVRDFGTFGPEPVDYPAFIRPAVEAVSRREFERGIVLGGSGNGEAIVANKVKGIRCALCWSLDTARWGREHNDANVLAIGQRTVPVELALEIVRVWLTTDFAGGRHLNRVRQIEPENESLT